jgi:anti-sigma B factor antagonist
MCQAIGQDVGQVACLDVMISTHPARSYVQLRGELDLTTAPGLEQRLDRLRRDGHRQIILDLSGLEFLSAAGLTVLLRADQALRALGGRLVLTGPPRIVRRVFAITGLDATSTIQPVARDWVSLVDHVDLGSAG